MYQDELGNVYYGNVHSGETQWEAPAFEYGGQQNSYNQQAHGYAQPADFQYARALEDVTEAEGRLVQSAEFSPCNGPDMEAVEALEAADERLAALDFWLAKAAEHAEGT